MKWHVKLTCASIGLVALGNASSPASADAFAQASLDVTAVFRAVPPANFFTPFPSVILDPDPVVTPGHHSGSGDFYPGIPTSDISIGPFTLSNHIPLTEAVALRPRGSWSGIVSIASWSKVSRALVGGAESISVEYRPFLHTIVEGPNDFAKAVFEFSIDRVVDIDGCLVYVNIGTLHKYMVVQGNQTYDPGVLNFGLPTLFYVDTGADVRFRINSKVIVAASTPEPSTYALLTVGFGLIGAVLRRRVRLETAELLAV